MSIDKIIDDLYEILDNSWGLPLSGGKIIVDSKEIRCLLEDLRLNFPKEVAQAKGIVADRAKVMDDAHQEADRMIKVSEEKIRSMVNQTEIVKNAQVTASKILSDAKAESKEVKAAANKYVDGLLQEVDQIITSGLSEIRKARQALHSPESKNS